MKWAVTALWSIVAVMLLSACGAGGGDDPVNPTPTASLSVAPTSVASGGTATLTWSSTNATACTASGSWSGALATSGTQSTGALTADATYSLTCAGAGGTSAADTATVTVSASSPVPTVTLAAAPTSVASGAASTLTWSSTNATACTASGSWTGAQATSGSLSTGALTAAATYTLTCTGPGGTSTPATATVAVTTAPAPVPTVTLAAAPTSVASGAASTLTWSSTNATACTASGGWTGAKAASGVASTGPLTAAATFTLTCTGTGGTSTPASATVAVTAATIPAVTLTAAPGGVAGGGTATLTWSSTNATACTASGGWTGALATNGTQNTAAITATTTYSLVCAGAGGTSNPASVTVSLLNGGVVIAPAVAGITLSQTQQFAATVPGGGAATWTVDGIAGGNATVGTISAAGLYTAGTAAGTHSIIATSAADATQTGSAVAAVTDLPGVYTFHDDNARDGVNSQEYALTTATVGANTFGLLATCPVNGAIYAQPLWVANLTVNGAKHNVVFVATAGDWLYAFDADASPCTALWSVNLLDANHGAAAGETTVPSGTSGNLVGAGYGDISPETGVIGTPVIDPTTGILYVVSKSVDASQTNFYQRLHAIDITTGNEKTGSPAVVAATYPGTADGSGTVTFNPRYELQRTGLTLVNGIVYVAWASHEDSYPWYGWMMGYQYTGSALSQTAVLNTTPNAHEGGIWLGGGAPAADSTGNFFVATGNGTFDENTGGKDYGDTMLELTVTGSTISVPQTFTPSDQAADLSGDVDFGAGGVTLLPDQPGTVPHLLLVGDKAGDLYMLDRDVLGGYQAQLPVQKISFGGKFFATPAFWNGNFYVAPAYGNLYSYGIAASAGSVPTFNAGSTSGHYYGFPGSTPSVSASGTTNGLVWSLDSSSFCTNQSPSCGSTVLIAYDATNVTNALWTSPQSTPGNAVAGAAGYAVKFSVPTVANGKVYVGTRGNNQGDVDTSTSSSGELDIFGLTP